MADESDGIKWRAYARADKYSADQTAFAVRESGLAEPDGAVLRALCGDPEDGYVEAHGNLLVTVGLSLITNLLIGGTTAGSIKNAQAICGTGATATAATVADTALGADGGSAYYQQADATYPSRSNGVMTMVSTFASGNGNFAWQEWCWASCTSGSITGGATLASVATGVVMWNHKVQSLGTKASGASWVFTTTITLS
jgi:hypothetical protein